MIVCVFHLGQKNIFYGQAELIKKRVEFKKKKVDVCFKHSFLSIYNHKKLKLCLGFYVISYFKNFIIPAYGANFQNHY